jgi:hypothetical protein
LEHAQKKQEEDKFYQKGSYDVCWFWWKKVWIKMQKFV